MPLEITAATARLIREMAQSEETIADALVATTALFHTAALASREVPGAPALETQAAFLNLNKTLAGLIEARGAAMRVHGQLLDIGREMGATETPYCPRIRGQASDQQKAA